MQGSWRGEMVEPPAESFRPLRPVATILMVLLGLNVLIDAIAVVFDVGYLSFVEGLIDGSSATQAEAEEIDARQLTIGLVQAGVFLLTLIFFIIWFRRAYRNLQPLGVRSLRFKAGWAVGAWFVPFLNLIRPKEMANDIWRASDPDLPVELNDPGMGQPVSPWIDAWWVVGILNGLLYRATLRGPDDPTLDQLAGDARVMIFADLSSILLDVLALMVVLKITRRQEARRERVGTALQASVPPTPAATPSTDQATQHQG